MTENKPIMIDGVDVSGCEYYQYNMCTATKDNYGDCSYYCKDYDMKNCYFKQLTRKTQECEELKERFKKFHDRKLDESADLLCKLHKEECLKFKAEQKLEKIAEIANNMHDMWINKTQYTDVYNLAEHLLKCELNRIINEFDKIDEVE